jgi:hypothetical protein
LRWDDQVQKGAWILRTLAGGLWVLLSISWLREASHEARLPVYCCAAALSVWYGVYAVFHRAWKPRTIPIFAVAVWAAEPGTRFVDDLNGVSPGFIAVGASFLLFGLGSLVAFSKSTCKRQASTARP